jgi:lysophospholipid acyltransferase
MALVDESLFKNAEGKTKPGRALPTGRKRVAYVKMFMGLTYLGIFVVLGGSYNYGMALTSWFSNQSLVHRFVLVDAKKDELLTWILG